MIVLAVSRGAAGFDFHAARAKPVSFYHIVAQGKPHAGRQRMHDIFHPFRHFFFTTPQRSQINMAELWVGWSNRWHST